MKDNILKFEVKKKESVEVTPCYIEGCTCQEWDYFETDGGYVRTHAEKRPQILIPAKWVDIEVVE